MSDIGRGICNVGRWYVIVGDAESLFLSEASCMEGISSEIVISGASRTYESGGSKHKLKVQVNVAQLHT